MGKVLRRIHTRTLGVYEGGNDSLFYIFLIVTVPFTQIYLKYLPLIAVTVCTWIIQYLRPHKKQEAIQKRSSWWRCFVLLLGWLILDQMQDLEVAMIQKYNTNKGNSLISIPLCERMAWIWISVLEFINKLLK